MSIQYYYLGCPLWSNRAWNGVFFTADARPADFLRQYSSVFNSVEGNTTFYALPAADTVKRWRNEAQESFRFCCKFSRTITHDRRLRHAGNETREFFDRLSPLADRLGPFMLQLPASFGPAELSVLDNYLTELPNEFHYAVEVRHPDFFAKGDAEKALNRLLVEHGMDRVMLDSRALFSATPTDNDTRDAQRRKPRLPVHAVAIGQQPLIRFIGCQDLPANQPFLEPWIDKVTGWIKEGRQPYVFLHTPNNHHAPELAQLFHERLRERLPKVDEMPSWPITAEGGNTQLGLFG